MSNAQGSEVAAECICVLEWELRSMTVMCKGCHSEHLTDAIRKCDMFHWGLDTN